MVAAAGFLRNENGHFMYACKCDPGAANGGSSPAGRTGGDDFSREF